MEFVKLQIDNLPCIFGTVAYSVNDGEPLNGSSHDYEQLSGFLSLTLKVTVKKTYG